ncbi:MAG: PadR family transcriptional regulator [Pseudomonadota bacterium]
MNKYCVSHSICCTVQADVPLLDKLTQELRRGGIVLAVLGALRQEHYGYSLRKALEEEGLAVEEGTLYPLVRRLEQQGLLTSEWREEGRRKKRFYRLSADGTAVLAGLRAQWRALSDSIERITAEE